MSIGTTLTPQFLHAHNPKPNLCRRNFPTCPAFSYSSKPSLAVDPAPWALKPTNSIYLVFYAEVFPPATFFHRSKVDFAPNPSPVSLTHEQSCETEKVAGEIQNTFLNAPSKCSTSSGASVALDRDRYALGKSTYCCGWESCPWSSLEIDVYEMGLADCDLWLCWG